MLKNAETLPVLKPLVTINRGGRPKHLDNHDRPVEPGDSPVDELHNAIPIKSHIT